MKPQNVDAETSISVAFFDPQNPQCSARGFFNHPRGANGLFFSTPGSSFRGLYPSRGSSGGWPIHLKIAWVFTAHVMNVVMFAGRLFSEKIDET